MGTWMIRLPKISHRNCGHLREIGYRVRSMSWWCSRRLYVKVHPRRFPNRPYIQYLHWGWPQTTMVV